MDILLLEDDHNQVELIVAELRGGFPAAKIVTISTERDFRSRFEEIAVNPPAIFLIDIMVRWTDSEPNLEVRPQEVKEEGFYRAGLRCLKLIKLDDRTKDIPVIFYTVLENHDLTGQMDLSEKIVYLQKESSFGPLLAQIRYLTSASPP
jgi:CheY-like chemotaxis protein